jgi:branched-chain amino acid transport system ATP-binding protein
MIESLLGASPWEFLGVTLVIFGGAGFMLGQALAETWRPFWHAVPYSLLLAGANRFLSFALFKGTLLSLTGLLVDFAVVVGLALLAYRATRAHMMVRQYPWLYERDGLFSCRDRR